MRYREWLDMWLKNFVTPVRKARTTDLYTEIAEKKIIPYLGGCDLDELTPIIIQRYVTKLSQNGNIRTGKGLSPNSVNGIISVIQSSLQMAYRLGYTKDYIGDKIIRPKTTEKRIECFTIAEQRKIEQTVLESKTLKMRGIVICLYTGLRIGELLALTWNDVNFAEREISVSKSCYHGKCGRVVYGTKTVNSVRTIPLSKPIIKILREMKSGSESEYVISAHGNPVETRTYQKNFEVLLKKMQIGHHGFHALRHTFATRALECGMDVKTLSEIMGHKDSSVTLNRYVHCLSEHKKAMMNRLGKYLE